MADPVEVLRRVRGRTLASPLTMEEVVARAKRRSRRKRSALVLAALMVVGGTAGLFAARGPAWQRVEVNAGSAIPLDRLPEGVSARIVDGVSLFIVRHGHEVKAFVARTNHLGGEMLWWCPAEQVFASPAHSEVYTPDGVAVAGPAPRGLDRVAVRVDGDLVRIDPTDVTLGPPRLPRSGGGFSWGDGPDWAGGFCRDPVKAPPAASSATALPAPCRVRGPLPLTVSYRVRLPDGRVFLSPPGTWEVEPRAGTVSVAVTALVHPDVRLENLRYFLTDGEGGKPVRTLLDDRRDGGGSREASLTWDLRNDEGMAVAPGRYHLLAWAVAGPGSGRCLVAARPDVVELGVIVVP